MDSVIHNPDIDAVVIATPVKSHYDITIQALNAGKHVLVEKLMATKIYQVREIGQLAKEKDYGHGWGIHFYTIPQYDL